jgi:hypothetical protein
VRIIKVEANGLPPHSTALQRTQREFMRKEGASESMIRSAISVVVINPICFFMLYPEFNFLNY